MGLFVHSNSVCRRLLVACQLASKRVHSSRRSLNLVSAVTETLLAQPNKVLITEPLNDSGGKREQTSAHFINFVHKYAACLVELGVHPGDRVIVQAAKSADVIVIYLATLQLGAIFVPLSVDYTSSEVCYFVENARPKLFVTSDHTVGNGATGGGVFRNILSLSALRRMAYEGDFYSDRIESRIDSDPAAICYTSGTTGKPKGAVLTHGNLLSNATALGTVWRMNSDDVMLHALPLNHVHGLFISTNTALLAGAGITLLPGFKVDSVLDWLPKCSLMMGVPTYYTRLLADGRINRTTTANIRVLICGSAPLLPSVWSQFADVTGHELLERYGMTEGLVIASNPYDKPRKCGTVGFSLPGIHIRLRNGELQYKGANVFAGYWMDEQKTKEEFTDDGYFRSGDLAEFDEDGYLKICGRSKDLIISGGVNVYPKEIEDILNAHPYVLETAVIGLPDADFGEAVCAVVVTNDDQRGTATTADLVNFASLKLARYKLPKRVFFLDTLPRNAMGKVQKTLLREQFGPQIDSTVKKR